MKRTKLLHLVVLAALAGCGGGKDSVKLVFTTTDVEGHSHEFAIPEAVLFEPPRAGFSASTSSAAGHDHVVTLPQSQLIDLGAGAPVTVRTSLDSGHTHELMLEATPVTTCDDPCPDDDDDDDDDDD